MSENNFASSLKVLDDYSSLISYSVTGSNAIKIISNRSLNAVETGSIVYQLFKQLQPVWKQLSFQIQPLDPSFFDQRKAKEFLELAVNTPFLWEKREEEFHFFLRNPEFLDKISYRGKINTFYVCVLSNELVFWKQPLLKLKRILNSLGMTNIFFFLHALTEGCKFGLHEKKEVAPSEHSNANVFELPPEEKQKILLQKFKDKKIFELGVHTNFSTLDGISSAKDYIFEAIKKDYSALAVTDHYNVQSFPSFSEEEKKEVSGVKVVYGCEFQMLEDSLPELFLNNFKEEDKKNYLQETDVEELKYCLFDLETTGLYSEYNEIVEIGYRIFHREKIIEEKDFLVRPEKDFTENMLRNWYHRTLTPEEIMRAPKISSVIKEIRDKWQDCVLVAHNATFDYGFLRKLWLKEFKEDFPFPILDTLTLARIVFPEKKSYTLENLSNSEKSKKVVQVHRALDDCVLLTNLLIKAFKEIKTKGIKTWRELVEKCGPLRSRSYWGERVKVLVKNQEGLRNIYRLVTISHTERLYRTPCIFRSDLLKHREGLIVGASGNDESEVFWLFSSFSSEEEKRRAFQFYDFIEVNSPTSLSYVLFNGSLEMADLQSIASRIVKSAEKFGKVFIASHNVHYCEKKEKVIKDILIANEGLNGTRHYLYRKATAEEKEDLFDLLPSQHLLSKEEMIEEWLFLSLTQVEKILFENPKRIVDSIEPIAIKEKPLDYSNGLEEKRAEVKTFFIKNGNRLFGENWPAFIKERVRLEWEIIKEKYVFIFWLALKIAQKAHRDKCIVGSRGSVGSSAVAFLCGITELNPLPFYKYCSKCRYVELFRDFSTNFSCFDYAGEEVCPQCKNCLLKMRGHNIAHETFFGVAGEKNPDIDLNFAGDYQKVMHNYVRELLGNDSVYRIGTINTLKASMAEVFWKNHLNLRKQLTSKKNLQTLSEAEGVSERQKEWLVRSMEESLPFKEERWYEAWVDKQNLEVLNRRNGFDNEAKDKVKTEIKENILKKLEGIKRTTGQHPGGLVITKEGVDINNFTPLNYPGGKKSEFATTHLDYEFLSQSLLKIDILGHEEPKVLKDLHALTGQDPLKIPFQDEKVMSLFNRADTLGVTEFGTDFVRKMLLTLKPTKFSNLLQVSGFAHGPSVWLNNQQSFYKNKLLTLDELVGSRDDIWNYLETQGLDKRKSFVITEYIRKGKWDKIPEDLKEEMEEKLGSSKKGKMYLEIFKKIEYMFPKPHAISYTMTAWRSAFYKVYYPQEFYSIVLTYHTVIHDILLMSLEDKNVRFRLNNLLENIDVYKNSFKEVVSITKVLRKMSFPASFKLNVDEIVEGVKKKAKDIGLNLFANFRGSFVLTAKEKELLYTLRMISEMKEKFPTFRIGVDLNRSEATSYKIKDWTVFVPISAITGFGEIVAKKIVDQRQKEEKVSKENWSESLKKFINVNHLQQLKYLEECGMLLW